MPLALLAGDVEDAPCLCGRGAHLQEECGLADAGRAAHEDQGPEHGPAAEDTVKLRDPGGKAHFLRGVELLELFGLCAAGGGRRSPRAFPAKPELRERVPRPAGGALPCPVRRLAAAFGAEIDGFLSVCHVYHPYNKMYSLYTHSILNVLQIGAHDRGREAGLIAGLFEVFEIRGV